MNYNTIEKRLDTGVKEFISKKSVDLDIFNSKFQKC